MTMGRSEELQVVISAKDQASAAIQSVGQSLKGLSTTAMAAAGVLAGVFAYKTVKSFGDFDQAMRNSMAIMGDVSDEMKQKLIDRAREVARTMAVSHKEAAESYYYLASAGLSAAESLEAMPKVARLAEAANMDMASATDIAVNALRAFELQVGDLGHVSDVLVGTVTSTNTNMMQLGEALKYVAPVAQSVGWSIEEVSAAIGVLANSGIKGSQAGTGLRRMLSELLNPSDRAKEALEKLGLTMEQLDPRTHSLTEIIGKLKAAGADAADIMAIFGDRGGQVALKLMAASEQTADLTSKLKEMNGITEKIAKEQEEGLNAQLKILKNNMNDLAITVGEQLAPTIKGLADKLKELAQDQNTVEFFKNLGEGMAAAFNAAADAFMAFSAAASYIPAPIGKLLGALAGVVMVVGPTLFIFNKLAGVVSGVAGAFGGLGAIASAASTAITAVGTALAALVGAITLPIAMILALIAVLVALAFNVGGVRTKLVEFAKALGGAIVSAANSAKAALTQFASAVKSAVDQAWNAIKSAGSKFASAAKELGSKVVSGIKSGLASLKSIITAKLNEVVSAVKSIPGRVKSAAVGIGRAIIDGIRNGLSGLASAIKSALLDPIRDAINGVKNLLHIGSPSKVFEEIGKNVVIGYKQGIEKVARDLKPVLPSVTIAPGSTHTLFPIGGSNKSATVNITLNGVAIREDNDIERLADAIEERLGRRIVWS